MSIGFWQIVIVVLLLVLLFGRGKISDLMGDVAQGIKSFKKGMTEDDETTASAGEEEHKVIEHTPAEPVAQAKPKTAAKTARKPAAKSASKRKAAS